MYYKVKETFDSHLLKRETGKGHFEKGEVVEMDPKLAKRLELLLEEDKEHKAPRKKKYRIKKERELPVLRNILKRERALFKKGEEVLLDEETAKLFADYIVEPEKETPNDAATGGQASPGKKAKTPDGAAAAVKEK